MRSSKVFFAITATIALLHVAAATAATIDMNDPRRVVGRENDVRVDAQLQSETIAPGAPISVAYQIQNLTAVPIAVADKVITSTYDADTQTVVLSIGAEVPPDGRMPHVAVIAPGDTKFLRIGVTPSFSSAMVRISGAPRYVQLKVSVLRDLTPFATLIAQQSDVVQAKSGKNAKANRGIVLSDGQFEQWFESNDTILLNTVTVRFSPRSTNLFSADAAEAEGSF
jgi:hypothetical protein